MSTKAEVLADPNSVWNKTADDEPVFVMVARDPFAYQMIRRWANLYFDQKKFGRCADFPDQQVPADDAQMQRVTAKFNEAIRVAEEMAGWLSRRSLANPPKP